MTVPENGAATDRLAERSGTQHGPGLLAGTILVRSLVNKPTNMVMFALRRTPATIHTPYADKPPIIRIPYVWFRGSDDQKLAVVMLMGDKSATGNQWYPQRVNDIETRLIPDWERNNPGHRAIVRKTR